jgi:hypothetical protein
MGHCGNIGYVLWSTAATLVMCYGPLWQHWLCAMVHCGNIGYVLWSTAATLVMCYGPLRQHWLCAMVHCGNIGYVLWSTAATLVMCYGPLRQIWLNAMGNCTESIMLYGPLHGIKMYNKICDGFRTVGHSAGFGYSLWAIAQDLDICYGPQHRILLWAIGHSAEFGYALWAIVPNQLP